MVTRLFPESVGQQERNTPTEKMESKTFRTVQSRSEFRSVMLQLGEVGRRGRDVGMLQLYLTCFVYFVTKTVLEDREFSREPMVDAFMRDVEEDRIQTLVKIGLAGVNVKDGPIEVSNTVRLRRLNRSDYHEDSEPLADKSIDRISFPSQNSASSVLELSVKLVSKLDPLYDPPWLFDVRTCSSIREFDLLIQ